MEDGKWYDLWMVPHFLGWALIVAFACWFTASDPHVITVVIGVLIGSAVWEYVEYAREGVLRYQREPWTNRLLVDPVVNTMGGLVGWQVYLHLIM
jgi:hypothetical protein